MYPEFSRFQSSHSAPPFKVMNFNARQRSPPLPLETRVVRNTTLETGGQEAQEAILRKRCSSKYTHMSALISATTSICADLAPELLNTPLHLLDALLLCF